MRLMIGSFVALSTFACGKSTPPPETTPPAAELAPAPAPDAAAPAPDAAAPAPDAAPAAPDAAAAEPESAPLGDGYEKVPPAAIPPATPVTGACIAPGEGLRFVGVEGRTLSLCTHDYEQSPACWDVDLDAARASKAKIHGGLTSWPAGREVTVSYPKEVKVARDGKGIESCLARPCVKLDIDGSAVGHVAVANGRVVVAPSFESESGERALRVFDGTTGALVSKLPFADLGSECPEIAWAGELLYVELGVCAGPGAVGAFHDPATGKRVGWLGGEENVSAYGVRPFLLPSGLVAFREQYGHALYLHDGKTGALVKTMNLDDTLVKVDGEPSTDPEEGTMLLTTAADGAIELVVVNGGESRRRVVIIDPVTASVKRVLELTICAPK